VITQRTERWKAGGEGWGVAEEIHVLTWRKVASFPLLLVGD